jgi:hypothetical protein
MFLYADLGRFLAQTLIERLDDLVLLVKIFLNRLLHPFETTIDVWVFFLILLKRIKCIKELLRAGFTNVII